MMFDQLYVKKYTVHRHQEAPLLQERLQYLQYWSEHGARRSTLILIANYLLAIISYLDLENRDLISPLAIARAAKKWASRPYKHHQAKDPMMKQAKSCFIWHATQWLNMLGRLKCQTKKISPSSKKISQYMNYMRHERGLSEVTIRRRVHFATDFLNYIDKAGCSLHKLNIQTIDAFLAKKRIINRCSRCSMHSYARFLRAFIRYAEQRQWCSEKLAEAIKIPRMYKDEDLPYSPAWNDVKKMIAGTEGDCPQDIRDRAILMLLAIYGLRRSEVAQLKLDDINWEAEIIYLKRAKNSKPQQFPLCQTVGTAILRYIKKVRPNKCLPREIFISVNAPYRPLSNSAISSIVYNRWKPLNIKIKHYGAHSLRHACATRLINEGASLKEIGDHLGHQSIESTRIYTKVDLTSLRKVADFMIGDLL